jgi:hypothetical protein
LKSKIINMADRIKDAEDRLLESMFSSEPIADDGFSKLIVRRIRRRLWVKRLALPVAAVIGASIAAGPMIDLAQIIAGVANVVPQRIFGTPADWIPQLHIVLLAGMLAVVAFVGAQALED